MFTILRLESVWPDGKHQNQQIEVEGLSDEAQGVILNTLPAAIKDSNTHLSGNGSQRLLIDGCEVKHIKNLGWSEMRANEDRVVKTMKGWRTKKK